jgi:uncharacterized protein YydD (DUF2326 family)
LDEYTQLQERHLDAVAQLNDVEARISNLTRFEEGRSSLRIEQELLHQRTRRNYEERRDQRQRAINLFNENTQALYRVPGTLVIDVRPEGFKFNVLIERSASQGVTNMKVFCYDLTLAQLWAEPRPSPTMVCHDSTIFDGVDERQVARALELAATDSVSRGYQYICTLNSDTVPWQEFEQSFDLNPFVRLRLTDTSENGSLLGVRF